MKKPLFYHCAFLLFLGGMISSCSTNEEAEVSSEANLVLENAVAKKEKEKINVFKGPQVQYGAGKARSWISIDAEGKPVEIALTFTQEVFDDLESLSPTATVLPLHQKAREVTPFEHIGVNWSPHGHLPVFLVPHFDLHFYMITNEERLAIPEYSPETDALFNNYPPAGYMPENYVTPPGEGSVYPQMGKHWLPMPLENYLPFTSIMVLGSYNGEFTFIEPMMTVDMLMSSPDFSDSFAQPEYFQESTYYPTVYNIYEDPETQDIHVTLSDFVLR
ncbi:hypothetical protein SAMN04488034_103292 [Salinimicrobium catena]|uniref:Uncharacterized protein n=1 Tax=Salinimicrobium catena TaxID=390640 RepID=A0A1H5N2S2_9FLAO|nr:DUF5602 domain-containing protein [Salinimicrobium catena]SDL35410.1 hypothetical protein SAMN04488140_103292 [Salinimicrobium catena]SEE95884.1 hypothetical protein SAMN04488034_103292 [Salinimicrobium catena]